jgi:phosphatidylserine/phosphatidylglycerophosphate/cardiolipin synthase-like enzyme
MTRSNKSRLLIDGEEIFDCIFEGLESAKEYILVQFYIVLDDGLGRELKTRLICKVCSILFHPGLVLGNDSHFRSKMGT